MESELFGYTRGAFTGANTPKLGLIEMANGGTAFFDEIGELPLELQSKLLRVLQEKEFRPVGALNLRRSDFRVISATNRDLAAEVEKGTFRRDLYYRLNVITIRVPPLRDRKEDIPELLAWFVRKHGGNHTFTQDAVDALASYDWPGNIRELENCVQHMLAVNSGPLLHTHDLSSPLMNHILQGRSSLLSMAASVERRPPIDAKPGASVVSLPEMERRAIFEALSQTKGDRATAAVLLGIGRTTLYRKLKEYNLE
jgi:transcriptional regulator with PAS, ATPase and Fis domain